MIHNFVSLSFFKALLWSRGSFGFIVGVIFCFGFSIAVILSTIGLMDGFEHTLKAALKISGGDISLHSKEGFFQVDQNLEEIFSDMGLSYSPLVQTEGFIIKENFSKGVLVKGVDSESFSRVSGLMVSINEGEIAVGRELASLAGWKLGDEVFLALMTRKRQLGVLPDLYRFRIGEIVNHNIYTKDMRIVYINFHQLQSILGLREKVNFLVVNKFSNSESQLTEKVNLIVKELEHRIDPLFIIIPFWKEFSTLLEAIEIEKVMLTLILQLLMVVAIFNIIAFIIFLGQYKAKEIFLFQALGLSQKDMACSWFFLLFIIWIGSCILAVGFSSLFSWAMVNMNLFKLPGEIYSLAQIETRLSWVSYAVAFALSLFWLFGISWLSFKRLKKKSLLSGVRWEFGS